VLYWLTHPRLAPPPRRRSRRREVADETLLELVVAPAPDYGGEVAAALERGLRALPLLQRQVVAMKLVRGMSFAEIADATHSSEGACRMRFLRGLEQLRDLLEQEGLAR
jgi:DNA-directed RNA polymerase specialized sigma24 family protein